MPQNYDFYGQMAGNALGGANAAGAFSLAGSPVLRAQRRREALRNSRNLLQRGRTSSRLVGLDTLGQRAALQGDQSAASAGTADYLNQSQFQEQQDNLGFLRGLFGQERGYEQAAGQAEQERRNQRKMQLRALIGQLIGQVGGAAVGAIGGTPKP